MANQNLIPIINSGAAEWNKIHDQLDLTTRP